MGLFVCSACLGLDFHEQGVACAIIVANLRRLHNADAFRCAVGD